MGRRHRHPPGAHRADLGESLPAAAVELDDRPLLYVTFGTVFGSVETLSMVLQAVQDLPCAVLATTGHTVDPASLGPLPPNVRVVPFLPQNAVIARSAAVVSHAGSGTVLGALAARRPRVCLPMGADEFINADQVARQGAGIVIGPGERDTTAVRSAVEHVLVDGAYAHRAAALQDEIDAMTPAPEALTALERRSRR